MYFLAQLIWVLPFAIGAVLLAGPVEQKSGPAALAFLAGFVLFVFVSIRMLLTAPIAVEEPALPHEIVKRSWKLSAGNWWRLFGFFLLFVIGAAIAILATLAVAGLLVKAILGELEPFSVAALLVSLASQIVMAGVYVLLMAMLARIYVQLSGDAAQASVPSSGT